MQSAEILLDSRTCLICQAIHPLYFVFWNHHRGRLFNGALYLVDNSAAGAVPPKLFFRRGFDEQSKIPSPRVYS